MRYRIILILLLLLLVSPKETFAVHGSGATLPATCTVGDTFTILPQALPYTCSSTNSWQPTTLLDPGTQFELYEEFATGQVNTTQQAGETGIAFFAAGSSSFVTGATRPGLFRLTTATADNASAIAYFGPATGSDFGSPWYAGDWNIDSVLIPASNSGTVSNFRFSFGVSENDINGAAAAFWIRYDTDRGDTTYMFQVCDAAGAAGCGAAGDDVDSAVVASSVTPLANTPTRFRIRRAPSGVGGLVTIYMRVNDETEKTFCSSGCDDVLADAPTTTRMPFFIGTLTAIAGTAKSMDLDYMYLKITGMSRY